MLSVFTFPWSRNSGIIFLFVVMMDISLQAKLTHTDGRLKIMKCIPWHMCERKRQGQILPFNYEDLVVI